MILNNLCISNEESNFESSGRKYHLFKTAKLKGGCSMKKTIILLWLISVLFCNLAIEEEMKSKTKLVYGKWGDKPGEFGLKVGENPMERGGPNDFFVNADDKIYVLDNINKTVQVFSSQGKYERTDQKLYQEAISKGNERTIAFEDGSELRMVQDSY